MSDGAPNCATSRAEYPVTESNRLLRTSRPKPIAAREPKYTAATAKQSWTKVTANMIEPFDQM